MCRGVSGCGVPSCVVPAACAANVHPIACPPSPTQCPSDSDEESDDGCASVVSDVSVAMSAVSHLGPSWLGDSMDW